MELILWRHAEAEDGTPDIDRKLTRKGIKQSGHMADWLRPRLPKEITVVVSPARRTRQTARALTSDFITDDGVGTSGSPESLLTAIQWPQARRNVVVVGHQPTMGQLAAMLLTGRASPWEVKKGAIVWLTVDESEGRAHFRLRAAMSPDLL